MNLRRGLFRLWIVGAALFVLALAFVAYPSIKSAFDAVASKPYASSSLAPKPNTKIIEFEGQLHEFPADFTDQEIATALKSVSKQPWMFDPPNPWATLGAWAAIAFGVPLAVLALGSSLLWALSGFAVQRN
jgi:hypothetical protein